MDAALCRGFGASNVVTVERVARPKPRAPCECLVQVLFSTVTTNDVTTRKVRARPCLQAVHTVSVGSRSGCGQGLVPAPFCPAAPFRPGAELAGTVESVPPGSKFKVPPPECTCVAQNAIRYRAGWRQRIWSRAVCMADERLECAALRHERRVCVRTCGAEPLECARASVLLAHANGAGRTSSRQHHLGSRCSSLHPSPWLH